MSRRTYTIMQSLNTAVVIAKHLIGIIILNYELHTYDILSSLYSTIFCIHASQRAEHVHPASSQFKFKADFVQMRLSIVDVTIK